MLNGRGVELFADSLEQRLALPPIVDEHPNLDQLVREQVDVDLMDDGRGQSLLPYGHERMQMVRLGAEGASFRGC